MNNSSIKIKDIRDLIEPLCPIKLIYNNKTIWDASDDLDSQLCNDNLYKNFWIDNADAILKKYHITIKEFHHCVVKIWSTHE